MRVFWCTKHGFCPQDEAGDKQLSHCLAQNGNRGCPNLIILPDKHPCDSNGNGNNGNGNGNGNGHAKGGYYMPPIRRQKNKYGSNHNGNGHNGHKKGRYKRKRAKWLNER